MDNEELDGVKFSEFPSQTPVNADDVVGLHSGNNARFSIANIVAAVRQGLASIFVPLTRTINNKALSTDITLDASDVGAVATSAVGAVNGVASLDNNGKVPGTQLDLSGKQDTITASGILMGDGAGGVTAATPGTDYQAPLTAGTDYATPSQLDGKANQAQLAYVESGTTASRAYAVGEYFCRNGLLYRAKTAISSGGTFTPGTNCEQVTGGGVNQIAPKLLMSEWVTGTGDHSIASLRSYNLFIVRVMGNDVNFRTLVVQTGVSTQINVDATASIYVRMTMLIDYINLKVSVTNISSSGWAGGTLQVWGVALPV